MKKTKTKDEEYPLRITLSTGETMKIPRQSRFDNAWIRAHGCSLMAEYIALQYLGVKKVGGKNMYPVRLLGWHKKYTPKKIKAKVRIKAIPTAVKKLSDGNAKYYSLPTAKRIEAGLKKGVVILEQKDPIHSVILFKDKGTVYVADHGEVKRTTVASRMKKALKKTGYRGMVVIWK